MANIKNAEILLAYHVAKAQAEIIRNESSTILRDKARLDKFLPTDAQKQYTTKLVETQKFIDKLAMSTFELSIVTLLSVFEKVAFEKYRNTYGILRGVINMNAQKPLDYYYSRDRFVKDDVDKLSGILKLIDGIVDKNLLTDFEEIKNYRDYIAHGKRFSQPISIKKPIEAIAETLDSVLTAIEN